MHRRKLKVRAKKDEEAARQFLRNKEKPKALLALRHKKFQDELIKQVDGSMMKLEELIGNVEMAQMQQAVVSALAQGTKALKKAQEGLSVDYVQKLMEENDEAQMQCEELNALLNGHGVSDDDADILKELRQIQEEHALEVEETIPKVPDHDLPEAEKVVDSSKESSKESMEKPKENSKAKSKEAAEKKAKTEKAIQKAREAVPA